MLMAGLCGTVVAGSLDSPGAPSSGSRMCTLQNLYDYLNSGTAATMVGSFQEPSAAPGSTMKTISQIYDDIKAKFEECDATAENVELGKKIFCTQPGSWGLQTGKICNAGTPTPTPTITRTPTITPTRTPTITPTSSLYGGLVAYYKLDETSGTTAFDSQGSHNGTNNGAAVNQPGKIGTAYTFDGINDVVTSNDNIGISGANSRTINLWYKLHTEELPNGNPLISWGAYSATNLNTIDVCYSKIRFWGHNADFTGSITVNTDQWTMATITYNGSNFLSIYVNGGYDSGSNLTLATTNSPLYLGRNSAPSTPDYANVTIDEVGIWNRSLTASEISELWNNGSGKALF